MANTLNQTKKRIHSIETTKKITRAMQLVATAKFSRSLANLNETKSFYQNVYDTLNRLLASVKDLSFLNPDKEAKSQMFVLITSSMGLCGAYNANVYRVFKELFDPKNDKVILVGNRGHAMLENDHLQDKIILRLEAPDEKVDYGHAQKIGRQIVAEYAKPKKYRAMHVIYTRFVNSLVVVPEHLQLLPIDRKKIQGNVAIDKNIDFEPSAPEVLKGILPLYMSSIIFGALCESKVSENSARRSAMEAATKNANELHDKLVVQMNRARQAAITQEISEIIAGSGM